MSIEQLPPETRPSRRRALRSAIRDRKDVVKAVAALAVAAALFLYSYYIEVELIRPAIGIAAGFIIFAAVIFFHHWPDEKQRARAALETYYLERAKARLDGVRQDYEQQLTWLADGIGNLSGQAFSTATRRQTREVARRALKAIEAFRQGAAIGVEAGHAWPPRGADPFSAALRIARLHGYGGSLPPHVIPDPPHPPQSWAECRAEVEALATRLSEFADREIPDIGSDVQLFAREARERIGAMRARVQRDLTWPDNN